MAELTSGETQGNIPLEAFDTSSLRHFRICNYEGNNKRETINNKRETINNKQ
jgi:hypothetical protein